MSWRSVLIILLSFASFLPICGRDTYRRYDVRDGLSDNSVKDICQDRNGYLWLATKDGFCRFNGHDFEVFCSSKTGELLNVDAIATHSDGDRIWLGSTVGLMSFNPKDERTTAFDKKAADGATILSGLCLAYDKNNDLWIGTYSGVFRWSEEDSVLTHFPLRMATGSSVARSLLVDADGNVWVGTNRGLFLYERASDSFTNISPKDLLIDMGDINTIAQVDEGRFLLGTTTGHLVEFKVSSRTFRDYPAVDLNGRKLDVSRIHSIFKFSSRTCMIGSDSGLFKFDLQSGLWSNTSNQISDESVYKFYLDQEGGLWIGTYFCGLNYMSPKQNEIQWLYDDDRPGSLSGNAVSEFCEDEKGNLWIATENGGLNYFNTKSREFSDYSSVSHNNLHAVAIIGDKLYIGTFSKGLDIMDLKSGQVHNYRNIPGNPNSLCNDYVYSILKVGEDSVMIGTNSGLTVFNPKKQTFSEVDFTKGYFICDLLQDDEKNIWVACKIGGIFKYSYNTHEWKHYTHDPGDSLSLVSDRIIRISEDSKGEIWFCSEVSGICKYSAPTDNFVNYGTDQGLPNSIYYGMLDDGAGNLWLSSNLGIIKYNPELKTSVRYTSEDGLQSNQFNYRSSYKAKDGTFYFGGVNGFNCFSPFALSVNKVKPKTVISYVRIRYTNREGISSVEKVIPNGQLLKIRHDVSMISIGYDCLSYVAPSQNRFEWKMEGIYDDWNSTEQRSVSFLKLHPGKYAFSVRGCNNDGFWSDETQSVFIKVLPSPYLSVWAKIIYILIATGLLALISKNIYSRNKERKEKKLYEAKIGFFTQISHEIKTPVTLIKSPLEQVIAAKKWDDNTEMNLNIIQKNVNRLLELIRQLLDFRKIDNSGYKLSYSLTDLNLLIKDSVLGFQKSTNDVEIATDLPEDDLKVMVDKDAFAKIISNLLANALKYAKSEVKVSLEEKIHNGKSYVRLCMEDDGPGIPYQIREKVFKPFFQEHSYYGNGFGIGLSVVKLLVEKHNGTVSIGQSDSGGCKVTVLIPILQTHENLLEEHAAKDVEAEDIPDKEGVDTIMIVEDTADMREFLARNFEDSYNVLQAADGAEALKILSKKSCDLIISDILMPEMNGYEFLKRVREDRLLCHIPIILLTALDSADSKIKGLEYGADAYIEKPFSFNVLKATVENLLENRKKIFEHFATSIEIGYEKNEINSLDKNWLDKVNGIIQENMGDENFSIVTLMDQLSMSRSTLQRKIKGITGKSPNEYIRLIRLKTAAQLLKKGYRVNEVCFIVGFNNMSYFSKCFFEQFGIQPKELIKQSQKSKA